MGARHDFVGRWKRVGVTMPGYHTPYSGPACESYME